MRTAHHSECSECNQPSCHHVKGTVYSDGYVVFAGFGFLPEEWQEFKRKVADNISFLTLRSSALKSQA